MWHIVNVDKFGSLLGFGRKQKKEEKFVIVINILATSNAISYAINNIAMDWRTVKKNLSSSIHTQGDGEHREKGGKKERKKVERSWQKLFFYASSLFARTASRVRREGKKVSARLEKVNLTRINRTWRCWNSQATRRKERKKVLKFIEQKKSFRWKIWQFSSHHRNSLRLLSFPHYRLPREPFSFVSQQRRATTRGEKKVCFQTKHKQAAASKEIEGKLWKWEFDLRTYRSSRREAHTVKKTAQREDEKLLLSWGWWKHFHSATHYFNLMR